MIYLVFHPSFFPVFSSIFHAFNQMVPLCSRQMIRYSYIKQQEKLSSDINSILSSCLIICGAFKWLYYIFQLLVVLLKLNKISNLMLIRKIVLEYNNATFILFTIIISINFNHSLEKCYSFLADLCYS